MTAGRAVVRAGTLASALALAAPGTAAAQQQALSAPAVARDVACVRGCSGSGAASEGSLVRVRGRSMAAVRWVVFLAGPGPRDDVVAEASRARPRSVDVRVPAGARSGRVRLRNGDGVPARPSSGSVPVLGRPSPAAGGPPGHGTRRDTSDVLEARVERARVFYAGGRDATLRYVVTSAAPVEVVVELVRRGAGPVARWTPGTVEPGDERRVRWDGTIGGAPAPPGRYAFRVIPVGAVAARTGERPEVVESFRFLDHKFPVRGPHDLGGPSAHFGVPRGGRTHQGHDVFAACGTPLVAARGGTVVFRAWHANAGHYVVVRGAGNGIDYVYMHLVAQARPAKGEHVRTGQRLGEVGESGNARGCHLHFELWSRPGWYEGGRPFDPLPRLRAWDASS